MTYYHARYPGTGAWVRAPFKGLSTDRNEAHLYPANDKHLALLAAAVRDNGGGEKLRLRQVIVAEDA